MKDLSPRKVAKTWRDCNLILECWVSFYDISRCLVQHVYIEKHEQVSLVLLHSRSSLICVYENTDISDCTHTPYNILSITGELSYIMFPETEKRKQRKWETLNLIMQGMVFKRPELWGGLPCNDNKNRFYSKIPLLQTMGKGSPLFYKNPPFTNCGGRDSILSGLDTQSAGQVPQEADPASLGFSCSLSTVKLQVSLAELCQWSSI